MDKELVKIRAAFADDKNLSGEAEGLAQLAPCKAAPAPQANQYLTPRLATHDACTVLALLLLPAVMVMTSVLLPSLPAARLRQAKVCLEAAVHLHDGVQD